MASSTAHPCVVCGVETKTRCSRCKEVFYCGKEHAKSHWKAHKTHCDNVYQAHQHTMHKAEFDRIRIKYKLDNEQAATKISEAITNGISAPGFAEQFGTTVPEAVVFLEWIQVGVKFKEQSIDVAKKAGFGSAT